MTSRSIKAAGAATVSMFAAALGIVAAAPASASVAECTNGANGFVGIPYNQSGTTQRSITLGGRTTVSLQSAAVQGRTRGYAKISGNTRAGDQVWMDWTTTGGNGWLQCGPWYVQSNGSPNTSAAQRTDPSSQWLFRACGLVDGQGGCTGWW
ncbi:hypothetical protein [Actinoplanes sp. N902-109]|uniref:hypothetical protein n=1 Tax=Actinoplanes sp. (strain N902-109) TaxID=649831 RepID=UPI0003295AB7|nr:hypothetical protein [Actinoplanes sp. N902-109]AGL18485.1 hypothetical protein L083_4975 [Actinoplanes sp. N902-109]